MRIKEAACEVVVMPACIMAYKAVGDEVLCAFNLNIKYIFYTTGRDAFNNVRRDLVGNLRLF